MEEANVKKMDSYSILNADLDITLLDAVFADHLSLTAEPWG
jgi:hypothetical protein